MTTTEPHTKTIAAGLLLLRLGAGGFMFGAHGLAKLLHFSDKAATFADPLHIGSATSLALATSAEVLGALLVAIGLLCRPAALTVLITMLVAGLLQHAADPWAKKELALLYAVVFAAIALIGPGAYSLDAWRARRRAGARAVEATAKASTPGSLEPQR